MRETFVQRAALQMPADADLRAPGAAVTVALCGSWDHTPPCALAPHHTRTDREGDTVVLRTLFAVEPDLEQDVRRRITAALAHGQLLGPDGVHTRWKLVSTEPAALDAVELAAAEHLRER